MRGMRNLGYDNTKHSKYKQQKPRTALVLKAFSWETDLWVTLGDFTVKNPKLGREICI